MGSSELQNHLAFPFRILKLTTRIFYDRQLVIFNCYRSESSKSNSSTAVRRRKVLLVYDIFEEGLVTLLTIKI